MLIKAWDILKLSFHLYKEHFKLIFKYVTILFIPTLFIQLGSNILQPLFINGNGNSGINLVIYIAWVALLIMALLFAFWLNIAIIRTCADIYLKMQRKTVHDELAETRPFVWPGVLVSIASTFAFAIWYAPFILFSKLDLEVFISLFTKPFNALMGFALLIPAIYFGVMFTFSVYNVAVHKQSSVMKALKMSKDIVHGRWWSVSWRLFVPLFAFYLISYIPNKLGTISVLYARDLLDPTSWEYIISVNLISAVFIATGLLLAPLVLFAKTILYAELRKVPVQRRR